MKVIAIANGYYDSKLRVPGEDFNIRAVEDFSIRWMDTSDKAILAHVKQIAAAKPSERHTKDEQFAVEDRARRHEKWLKDKNHPIDSVADQVETRRVNTGGTDGVVGVEVPKLGENPSVKDRLKLAQSISGRTDKLTAAEVDAIIAAASVTGGSDNDDRSRDMAIDQGANAPAPAPAPTTTDPLDHDRDGNKGGAKNTETGFASMTVPQLKAHAEQNKIDLGDATLKADIVAAIELASEAGSDI